MAMNGVMLMLTCKKKTGIIPDYFSWYTKAEISRRIYFIFKNFGKKQETSNI